MNKIEKTFKGKTVLITGHTGFKGSWLSLWMSELGADVVGLSLDIPTSPSNFEANQTKDLMQDNRIDIGDFQAVKDIIEDCQPDFVFHLAAQPLVKQSYIEPLKTFATNAMGTANLLQALTHLKKRVIVTMITSDKAYDNVEWVWGYRETDRLGGKDPYSASKGMAELVIKSYVESFFKESSESFIRLGIARAGNVIGGGDWAKFRIIPDCMIAWSKGESVKIRNPNSTRPWQHVFEPLSGYIKLAISLSEKEDFNGEAYNFGPRDNQNHTVNQLIKEMSKYWDNVVWETTKETKGVVHEAGLLKLNCDKALSELDWLPTLDLDETVMMTVEWYKRFYEDQSASMQDYSLNQIHEYMALAEKRKAKWIM
jgi:CDP-glucose 4,6-dehydratase